MWDLVTGSQKAEEVQREAEEDEEQGLEERDNEEETWKRETAGEARGRE